MFRRRQTSPLRSPRQTKRVHLRVYVKRRKTNGDPNPRPELARLRSLLQENRALFQKCQLTFQALTTQFAHTTRLPGLQPRSPISKLPKAKKILCLTNRTRLALTPNNQAPAMPAPRSTSVLHCSICKLPIVHSKLEQYPGWNAGPVATAPEARCCDSCNEQVVFPASMAQELSPAQAYKAALEKQHLYEARHKAILLEA